MSPFPLPTCLARIRAARDPGATGFVGEDAEEVGDVSRAGEGKEQDANAVGAFAAVVKQQLRDPRSDVKRCAEVSEDLAAGVEGDGWREARRGGCGCGVVMLGYVPPHDAGNASEE